MTNPRVLVFTVIFAGVGMSGVGLVLFLPQILKSLGLSNTQAGLLTSVPYVFGTHGDRRVRAFVRPARRSLLDPGRDLRLRRGGNGDRRRAARQYLGAGGVLPGHRSASTA